MKKNYFILVLIAWVFCSCNDCKDIACFTPPPQLSFNLVDKNTELNIFQSSAYNTNLVNVTDANNIDVDFELVFIDEETLIISNTIGWETEEANLIIHLGDQEVAKVYVNALREKGKCCSFTVFEELLINDEAIGENPLRDNIKIYIN